MLALDHSCRLLWCSPFTAAAELCHGACMVEVDFNVLRSKRDQQSLVLCVKPNVSCSCPPQDEYKNEPGTVVAADFYGATRLLPLTGKLFEGARPAGTSGGSWLAPLLQHIGRRAALERESRCLRSAAAAEQSVDAGGAASVQMRRL